ncbi:MAG: hypothetical protein JOZ83_02155 [Silvibacterium sp.]|nr:hypothetical protein [Silvibacterium sp.]
MNEILARAARLLQDPEQIRALSKVLPQALTDPRVLANLTGLPENKAKLLSGLGNTITGLLKTFTRPPIRAASSTRTLQASSNPPARSHGNKGTAIAGAVSLTAITGAVVVVGTVSAVALAKNRKTRPT